MFKTLIKVGKFTIYWIAFIFLFTPDKLIEHFSLIPYLNSEKNVLINKIAFSLILFAINLIFYKLYIIKRSKIIINGKNFIIEVKYGDILKEKNCKKVINFDECYTTAVGERPFQIKPTSICGQYLLNHKNLDIDKLIQKNGIQNSTTNSLYKDKKRYDSGTLIPNGDDLLMAFAKLDETGRGKFFSYQEYLDCLSKLWGQIDEYYGQKSVCIPILGAGLTRINDSFFSQQELLNIIICSYKLSPYKIKKPYKLCIVCKKEDDFSINIIEDFD